MNVLHIFKTGCHVNMAGERPCFSAADLERIADAYDPALHRAPLVLGHPKTDDPAYGWVSGLTAAGGNLLAFVEQVSEQLKEWVRAGRYGAISASFYGAQDRGNPRPGGLYLRHVGFLGAASPGVKGLDRPSFAEGSFCSAVDIDAACGCEFLAPDGFAVDPQGLALHVLAQDYMERYSGMTYIRAGALAEVVTQAKQDWERSAQLRAEFTERDSYVAFCEAEALGRVLIK